MEGIDGPRLDGSAALFAGAAKLPSLDEKSSPEKVRAVGRQLEGVFFSMMLERMRETMTEDGLFGDGPGSDVYGGLFDRYVGESISKNSNLGIADMIVRESSRRLMSAEAAEARVRGAATVEVKP